MPLFKSFAGERISSLGVSPDWDELDRFQGQISREHFDLQLRTVYCPRESWWSPWIEIEQKQARIRKRAKSQDWYVLRFSDSDSNQTRESVSRSHKKLRVVLDPGHLGGNYSEMEGRHFAIGSDDPVKEGDLSLLVAKRAQGLLEEKGVEVLLTRSAKKPVTEKLADDFNPEAEQWFKDRFALDQHPPEGKEKEKLIRKRREMLFYRVSEIYARADLINQDFRPDLTVCIHLNAAPWKDANQSELVDRNDYHVLVNGCYMGGELSYDNQRFEMLIRLLNGWNERERDYAESLSYSLARGTGLPAFSYKGPNALKIGSVPGVWARNLLANRLYRSPVVFLEPYIANSNQAYRRIRLGNYEGQREVDGEMRLSLVEEYAQAICEGILVDGAERDKYLTFPRNP
ncbi:MAG: hypothetical protein CBC00_02250 [Verrucomicrobia bacterium TMED40]|nr:MAG: hypothetical protein CBC00_02250 [Verrucomicrobia bacterium TMED40]